jgi:uncharacterized membrane protein
MRILLLAALLMPLALSAQSSTGEITGQVMDDTGAAIPGAKVMVQNTATGETRDYQTDETGAYLVTQLFPGSYQVTVEKEGFRRFIRSGIVLQVGQRSRIDARLAVGAVSESVEVTAQAPLLDSEEASLGQVIENRATPGKASGSSICTRTWRITTESFGLSGRAVVWMRTARAS